MEVNWQTHRSLVGLERKEGIERNPPFCYVKFATVIFADTTPFNVLQTNEK